MSYFGSLYCRASPRGIAIGQERIYTYSIGPYIAYDDDDDVLRLLNYLSLNPTNLHICTLFKTKQTS